MESTAVLINSVSRDFPLCGQTLSLARMHLIEKEMERGESSLVDISCTVCVKFNWIMEIANLMIGWVVSLVTLIFMKAL